MLNSILLIIVFAITVNAESILTKIGWRGAGVSVIVSLIAIFLGIAFLLILYYVIQYLKQKRASKHHSEKLFTEACDRLGLSTVEIEKTRYLLQHEKLVEPQVIFQSISMYERCVDKEIKELISRGVSEEQEKYENDILSGIRKKTGFHHLALEHPLVSTRNITIGQSGSLFGRNLKRPLIQNAHVVDSNEFTFLLQYNVDKEEICYVAAGDEVKFAFSRQNDSVYGVPLKVVSADGTGTIEVYHSNNLRRNQLRQYVRVEISLPLKFRLLNTDNIEKSEIQRGEVVEAKMSDISGGGMSFICERTLRVGDLISLVFDLPNAKFVGIASKVLRISLQEGKSKTFFKHHVQFKGLEPRRRDFIVKYVFDKQRQISQWR